MAKKRKFIVMDWLRRIIDRIYPEDTSNYYTYEDMDDAIEKWLSLYYDEPAWLKKVHERTLNLPATIASEFARLIMVEFDINVTGSKRADFISKQFARVTAHLRENLEEACAVGGIMFKPYVSNGVVLTDCITQDRFVPVEWTDDEITSAIFISKITKGKFYYFRLEKQAYDQNTRSHRVINRFFRSNSPEVLGNEIKAEQYPIPIDEEYTITNVDKPLFSFFRIPIANKIDKESPLGVSVYSMAIKLIMEADFQWDRFLWEYEGGELAIDASESALRPRPIKDGNGKEIKYETPKTKDRLFRKLNVHTNNDKPFYEIYAPTLRDSSYGHGLDVIMRKIEFACALGYGTLSDPQNVDKTAEEVKSSKERSFAVINNMQHSLQIALENYIYAIDQYTTACNLAPAGSYETQWNWGDGVLENNEKEQAIRLQEVNSNIIDKVEYLKWRYGVTEEQAKKMMPKNTGIVDFFHDEEGG